MGLREPFGEMLRPLQYQGIPGRQAADPSMQAALDSIKSAGSNRHGELRVQDSFFTLGHKGSCKRVKNWNVGVVIVLVFATCPGRRGGARVGSVRGHKP